MERVKNKVTYSQYPNRTRKEYNLNNQSFEVLFHALELKIDELSIRINSK